MDFGFFPITKRQIQDLAELVHKNRHRSFDDLDAKTKEKFIALREPLEVFLLRLSALETDNATIAANATEHVRNELFARVGWRPDFTPLGRAIAHVRWRKHSPRSWVALQMKEAVRDLLEKFTGQPDTQEQESEFQLPQLEPMLKAMAAECCQLKCHRRPPELLRLGHCRQACDILFFKQQDFSSPEVASTFGIPKSTAHERLLDCEAGLGDRTRAAAAILKTKDKAHA